MKRLILNFAYKFNPLMLRIAPANWLRKAKNLIREANYKELNHLSIEPFKRNIYPDGINLIGTIKAVTGLGQGCRLLAAILKNSNIPFTVYNYYQLGNFSNDDLSWNNYIKNECKYNINLIHLNPHELVIAFMQLDKEIWDKRYNIAFWLWEFEEFPDIWLPLLDKVDEVWTPSEFTSKSIRKTTNKPVKTIPYYIEAKHDEIFGRKEFGLPDDQFLFLMVYDSSSIAQRKNPDGVINAFKEAFSPAEKQAGIVIKAMSVADNDIKRLRGMISKYQNVYFLRDVMEKEKVNSLISCVNVVVSLHRTEGFGLVMAEAMYLGTPIIATNWSANTEFMNSNVACMVDYKLVEIETDQGPLKKGQRWADADIHQAAKYMRRLYEDKEYYFNKKVSAQKYIREILNKKKAADLVTARIKEILNSGSND
jgi:glycosyltransferase involved in cell wall biosynthesis